MVSTVNAGYFPFAFIFKRLFWYTYFTFYFCSILCLQDDYIHCGALVPIHNDLDSLPLPGLPFLFWMPGLPSLYSEESERLSSWSFESDRMLILTIISWSKVICHIRSFNFRTCSVSPVSHSWKKEIIDHET